MKIASLNEYKQRLLSQGLAPAEVERRVSIAGKFTSWAQKGKSQVPSKLPPQTPHTPVTNKHTWLLPILCLIAAFCVTGVIFAAQNSSVPTPKQTYKPNTRTLSFSGKLTDSTGMIIAEKTSVILSLYTSQQGGTQVYSSGVCKVFPNLDGVFQTTIGRACGSPIREDVFTKNPDLYLGVKIGNDPEMVPRTPITTSSKESHGESTSFNFDENGDILLSQAHPGIRSTLESENFAISSARGILLQSAQDGDISLSATESGQIKFLVGGQQVVQIKNSGDVEVTGNILPTNAGLQDLGSSNNRFKSLYVENIYPGLFGIFGHFKREGNTLSTTNLNDELILGSNTRATARVRLSPFTSDQSWINAGNFGIGTTNPTFNLEVNGSTRINGDTILGASSSPKITFNSSTLSFTNASAIAAPGNTVNALAFQTNLLSLDTKNNRLGVGTISPSNKLTIADSQANMSTLWVENSHTDANSKGITIKLGYTGGGNTSNEFITFLKGNGEVQGSIHSNGASGISYSSTAGDFAEYFLKDTSLDPNSAEMWGPGTLVCLVGSGMVRPCDNEHTNVLGVISNNAAFVGNSRGQYDSTYTLVGLVGQLQVKVSKESGNIRSGDPITYSSIPGVVTKATSSGRILGFAKQDYSPNSFQQLIETTIQPGHFEQPIKGTIAQTEQPVGSSEPATERRGELSSLLIKGFENHTVASIDEAGNATLSGSLKAQSIRTDSVQTNSLESQQATISGTLTAQKIESGTILDIEKSIADLKNQALPDPRLYEKDTSVFKDIGPIDSLTVLNKASLYDASVANSLLAGNVSIENDTITGLSFELKLSALSTINLLDGAVIVDRTGTLTTKGELIAQKGVRTNRISALEKGDDIKVSLGGSGQTPSRLQILDEQANEVAHVNSSGNAYFSNGISVDTFIAENNDIQNQGSLTAAINTNAKSAGTGEIPAGKTNVVIYHDTLTDKSLMYLTVTSKTNNQPVYISSKKICAPEEQCKSYFVVSIDTPISNAATFNWWIIN